MNIQIKNRFDFRVIFECDEDSVKIALEIAVAKGIDLSNANLRYANLSNADLRYANLSNADLSNANLRDADLRYANLRDVNLSNANLRNADLRYADLSNADLRDADLRYANLRDADLRYANLRNANLRNADLRYADLSYANLRDADLRYANLRDVNLRDVKEEFLSKISLAKKEVPGLYKFIQEGKIDGSCYEGACACFVGSIEKLSTGKVCEIKRDADSPIEKLFLSIKPGDTPANNSVSKIVSEWLEEFMTKEGISIPKKKVIWE